MFRYLNIGVGKESQTWKEGKQKKRWLDNTIKMSLVFIWGKIGKDLMETYTHKL